MLEKLEKELKELEDKYFYLQMVDTWDDSDYRYADELRQKMKEIQEKIKEEGEKNERS